MAEVVAFRVASWDRPYWVNPNPSEGRFNRAGEGVTQYLSLHPLTPWAEYVRAQGWRQPDLAAEIRLRVWVASLWIEDYVEVGFADAASYGIDPQDLVADDYSACQGLAAQLRSRPVPPSAVIAPSAALPGTQNVILFGPRVASPVSWDPIDTLDVPTSVVADDARSFGPLMDLVCHRGESHAELEAWKRGEPFVFRDPP